MEKLRAFLEIIKKYHFWMLCGFMVLISLVCWLLATGDLAKRFAARKSQIDTAATQVKNIASDRSHPSEETIKQINSLHGIEGNNASSLRNNVFNAWTRLYSEQHDSNPLPEVFSGDAAIDKQRQTDFETAFEKIRGPIEKLEGEGLDRASRIAYQNHIRGYFPKLFDLIERRMEVVEGADGSTGSAEGGRPPVRPGSGREGVHIDHPQNASDNGKQLKGIVDWADAEKVMDRFGQWTSTPTTMQIMIAQEDLWVYEALLRVVRFTNGTGPDRSHYVKPASHKLARIKEILSMEIGPDAVLSWTASEQSIIKLPSDSATGATASDPRVAATPSAPAAVGRGGGSGAFSASVPAAGAEGVSSAAILAGRYVDDKGKSLADPAQQPYAEFRMMPITLRVVIEQNAVPRLLTECANSSMRIDVRSVRILSEDVPAFEPVLADAAAAGTGAATGAAETGGRPTGGFAEGMHGGGMGRGLGGASGSGAAAATDRGGASTYGEDSVDPVRPAVPVEVQGIIYIYNPPDLAKLGTGAVAGGQGAAAADSSAATPAAATPAAGKPATGTPATPTPTPVPTPTPAAATPAAATPANPANATPAKGAQP